VYLRKKNHKSNKSKPRLLAHNEPWGLLNVNFTRVPKRKSMDAVETKPQTQNKTKQNKTKQHNIKTHTTWGGNNLQVQQ
jgi:hypothetical protein